VVKNTGEFTTNFKGAKHAICIHAYTDTKQGGEHHIQYKVDVSARKISRSACWCF